MEFVDFDDDGDKDLLYSEGYNNYGPYGNPHPFVLFENKSTETDIIFEKAKDFNNPMSNFENPYGHFTFTNLFNQDHISMLIRGKEEDSSKPPGPGGSDEILRYYDYKDILSFEDKSFEVDENSANMYYIGKVTSEYYGDEDITYTIESGNTDDAFVLDDNILLVNNPEVLDYETEANRVFNLSFNASDGTNSVSGEYTINVKNINDNAPVLEDQTVSLAENPTASDLVATLNATDADNLEALTYSITAGNTDDPFEITNNTIVVKTASVIDYETVTDHKFTLTVQVSDSELTTDATITVDVTDVEETTGIEDLLKNSLVFYPNPVQDQLNLIIGSEIQGDIKVTLVNSIGNTVKTEIFENQEEFKLDVSNLNAGVYFINIKTGETSVTKKIIIK
jgi:hypothetical protein